MEAPFGIVLVILAGMLTGTFMWPMKVIRTLAFEHFWFIGMFCGLFILPWIIVIVFVPNPVKVIHDVGFKPLLMANILAMGWGVANVLYGICIMRLGAALAGGILTCLGVASGVMVPLLFKGSGIFGQAPGLDSPQGIVILSAILFILIGVALISISGFKREKIQSGKPTQPNKSYLGSLILAGIAGILSSCISLSFVYCQEPLLKSVASQQVSEFVANVSFWAFGLFGGVFVNLAYPLWLMLKHKNIGILLRLNKETLLSAIIGIQLLCGAVMLGKGMLLQGVLGASVGFGIQQCSQITGNQIVGFVSGEWKGLLRKLGHLMLLGLAFFLLAIILLAWTNSY